MSFKCTVKQGVEIEKEGYFFKGLSFTYSSGQKKFDACFERNPDNIHRVVFSIYETNKDEPRKLLVRLTHPDYVVEKKPGVYYDLQELNGDLQTAMAVFSFLGIVREKKIRSQFHFNRLQSENQIALKGDEDSISPSKYSFSIEQKGLA